MRITKDIYIEETIEVDIKLTLEDIQNILNESSQESVVQLLNNTYLLIKSINDEQIKKFKKEQVESIYKLYSQEIERYKT